VPGKSPAMFFLVELYVIYVDWGGGGANLCSCGECDVDRLEFVSFYSPSFNQFWIAPYSVKQ
jgi:hypothetical protein